LRLWLLRFLPCSRKSAGGVARLTQSDSCSLSRLRPDPKDRRGKLIVLTDPGKRLIDEAISRHAANQERLLLSLTQAEQETLDALLKKLIAGL
jgi:DNA-binding MarR family transcriptional regulator